MRRRFGYPLAVRRRLHLFLRRDLSAALFPLSYETEVTSNVILTFADDRKINWQYIAPPSRACKHALPCSGTSRPGMPASKVSTAACGGELLNETLLPSLHHARATLDAWRRDDNTERPHSRLSWQTPATFAQTFTSQRGLTLRNPQSSAPAPVAQPAQMGKPQAQSLPHTDKSWGQRHAGPLHGRLPTMVYWPRKKKPARLAGAKSSLIKSNLCPADER